MAKLDQLAPEASFHRGPSVWKWSAVSSLDIYRTWTWDDRLL